MNHDSGDQELQTTEAADLPSGARANTARRAVLAVGVAGVAGVALAACGSGASSSSSSSAASGSSGSGTPPQSPSAAGTVVTTTSEVPVGGAKLAKADGTTWLVAQPTAGEFVCHSGICTHEGCPLTQVVNDEGVCNCHGSRFDANNGAVLQGPATKALPKQSIQVSGTNIILG